MALTSLISRQDSAPGITLASATSVTLVSSSSAPTYITVGGVQYVSTGTLTCNLATTGFGGLDTGSLSGTNLYYVYAVASGGALGLVTSLQPPSVGPSGFTVTRNQLVGAFYTNAAAVDVAVSIDGIPETAGTASYAPGWISSGTQPALVNGTSGGKWRRRGNKIEVEISLRFGSSTTFGTGEYYFGTPLVALGQTIDTGNLANADGSDKDAIVGEARGFVTATYYHGAVTGARGNNASSGFVAVAQGNATAANFWAAAQPTTWNTTSGLSLVFSLPVTNWKNTSLRNS